MKNIAIAVDSRSLIGAGHVSRAIAIAEELRRRRYSISWFVSDSNNFYKLLAFFRVGSDILNKIKVNQDEYIRTDILILDTYDDTFAKRITQLCKPRLVIQIVDELSPDFIFASMRWSGSILSERAKVRLGKRCELYSGLKFVPLRNELKELRQSKFNPINERDSIIVSLGTSDSALEIIDKVVNIIRNLSLVHKLFISHPHYRTNSKSKYEKVINPEEMLSTAVKYNSLVICGGGLTALELLYLQLNFVVLEVAANQAAQIDFLCRHEFTEELTFFDLQKDSEVLMRGLSKLTTERGDGLDSLGHGSSLLVDWIDRNYKSEV